MSVFSRVLFLFLGCLFRFFSRRLIFFFTGVIWTKCSRAKNAFHANFFCSSIAEFLTVAFFIHGQNHEIIDFFHGSLFIFHAKKKHWFIATCHISLASLPVEMLQLSYLSQFPVVLVYRFPYIHTSSNF